MIASLRRFRDDATTITDEGRERLIAVVRAARVELAHKSASDEDLGILLFGADPVAV